jgi:hypothetical protein
MTAPNLDPKAFWQSLEAAERARKEREHITREVKVRPSYRVAENDEPEPVVLALGERS